MKMRLAGHLFPVIHQLLRLCVFNELAVFSEEEEMKADPSDRERSA
jgi:hypothetical protein